MTNLNKIFRHYDVHSHNQQEVIKDLLANYLPYGYTDSVISKLKLEGIETDSSTVRNVKHGSAKNIAVFNAIIEVASEQRTISIRLKKNLKSAV